MFTSPTSERTALLWGDAWWVAGRDEPIRFASPSQAAAALAAAWPDERRSLRVIFEPTGFVSVGAECPQADRATVGAILGDLHPALATPGLAWSHEPILPKGEVCDTVLHHEAEPALTALVEELAVAGFTVTGAWPLVTWLNALPSEVSESGAVLVVALSCERVCFYRHSASGARSVQRWNGESAVGEFGHQLREILMTNPAEPVWLVPTEPELIMALDGSVSLADKSAVEVIQVGDALLRPTTIPSRHPAQLLPLPRKPMAGTVVMLAGWMLLCTTLGITGNYLRDYATWRRDAATIAARKAALRIENAHRRSNAAEIAALRASETDVAPRTPASDVLARIAATIPPGIVLDGFAATGRGFEMTGWHEESTAVEPWLATLRANQPGWELTAGGPGASFNANVVFRP